MRHATLHDFVEMVISWKFAYQANSFSSSYFLFAFMQQYTNDYEQLHSFNEANHTYLDYLLNEVVSYDKCISPLLQRYYDEHIDSKPSVTEFIQWLRMLSRTILTSYGSKWEHIITALQIDYTPSHNYDMKETSDDTDSKTTTPNLTTTTSKTTTPNLSTATSTTTTPNLQTTTTTETLPDLQTTTKKTTVPELTTDTSVTTTPNLTTTNNRTTTPNLTTTTSDVTKQSTGSKTTTENNNGVFGFNSSSLSPESAQQGVSIVEGRLDDNVTDKSVTATQTGNTTDSENISQTGTNKEDTSVKQTGTTTEEGSTTQSGKNTETARSHQTGTTTEEGTTTQTGTTKDEGTTTKTGTTSETSHYNHTFHREGNIGVTTTQKMLTEELELRRNRVTDIIIEDVSRFLCMRIYQ